MNSLPQKTNLPANIPFHEAMEANRPSMISNVANACKHFFRFTIDKIERAVRYIFGANTTEPSNIQKAISIRTTSATHMLNNASLPLDGNKNLRAHRASLKEMLDIYPDTTAVSLYSNQNRFTEATYKSYKTLPTYNKNKCVKINNGKSKILIFKRNNDIFNLVNTMINNVEKRKQDEFHNNKEIKIILETPPFLTPLNSSLSGKDCAKAYITACEAWQLHLQIKYNKKVTILPFRTPENTKNPNHKIFTINNNNDYDSANAELALINKKDREIELFKYINDHINYQKENPVGWVENTGNNNDNQPPNTRPPSNSRSDDHLGNRADNKDSIDTNIQSPSTATVLKSANFDLTTFLTDAEDTLKEYKTQGSLSSELDSFIDNGLNTIELDMEQSIQIDNIKIHSRIEASLQNPESKKKSGFPFSLLDRGTNNRPSLLGNTFMNTRSYQPQDNNTIQETWDVYLNDYQELDRFAKNNKIDIGEAVIMYLNSLSEYIFDQKKCDDYIKYTSESFKQDIQNHLKIDTNTPQDVNVNFIVNLNVPKEFLTALKQSKNRKILSLVQTYGVSNLATAAMNI
jgi:hypothetical protein